MQTPHPPTEHLIPTRLIVNADDFGLTAGVNRAVAELHRAGVLTSATLMANGPAFADAVATAHRNPRLGVGCHVVLADGVPVSPPASIPTLIGPDGRSFRPSVLALAHAALRGRVLAADVRREALAQIRKMKDAGIRVTHLDTHKHTHLLPAICAPLLQAADAASIPAIRNPFEPTWSRRLGHASPARRLQFSLLRSFEPRFKLQPALARRHTLTTDGTLGISATGSLDQHTLEQILLHLPDGTWELVCHPGYDDRDLHAFPTRLRAHRHTELRALLAVLPRLLSRTGAPSLIHFGDLGDPGSS